MYRKRMRRFTTALIIAMLTVFCSSAQSFDHVENAVYVYNFIRHTSWPEKKQSITVGVIGTTETSTELRRLFARKTNPNTIYQVRDMKPAEADQADVLLIAREAANSLKAINMATSGQSILIISEKENMSAAGACISFFIDEDDDFKTGYQLSLRNCAARHLQVAAPIRDNAALTR